MLYLISLGFGEKDISLKGLEAAKKCDILYLENYTNKISGDFKKLIGKEIKQADREQIENKSQQILEEAKEKNVGILVSGDALAATTHISLVMDAKKEGIQVDIIHGPSIFTVISETGLQLYKFGMTTTLPFPEQGATSWYDVIRMNLKNGLHTLVLLDVKPPKYMTVKQAVQILRDQDKENILPKLIGASNLGTEKQKIKYGNIEDMEETPAVIIVPGKLHFLEEEFLESL